MIKAETNLGDEEFGVLADLIIGSSKSKMQQRLGMAFMIVAGLYLLVVGGHSLLSGASPFNVFCLVMAVAAFYMAFGGEKALMRRGIIRRSKKANAKQAGSLRTYVFDENETTISSQLGTKAHPWNEYTAYGETSHYLWIQREDSSYVLVDMSRMSEEDGNQLRSYCREKIR